MTLICPKVSNLYLKFEDIVGVKNILVLCITETIIGEKKKEKYFSIWRKFVEEICPINEKTYLQIQEQIFRKIKYEKNWENVNYRVSL